MGEALAVIDGFLADGSAEAATAATSAQTAVTTSATTSPTVVEVPGGDVSPAPKSKGGLSLIQGGLGKVPEVQNLPTPSGKLGSVTLLLLLILFIMFAVTQAPGQTISRLALMWQSILGNTSLSDSDPGTGTPASDFEMPAWAMQGGW